MELKPEKKENYIIANPSGKIDATNAENFSNSLLELLNDVDNIIVNFKDVDYISSAGLRSVLVAAKESQNKKGKFVLCALQEHIFEIFEMTGLTKMLNIVSNIEEAEKIIKE